MRCCCIRENKEKGIKLAYDKLGIEMNENKIESKYFRSINKYLTESIDKYFAKQEIEKIKKDINAKEGQFIKFVDDKVDKNLSWKAACNDYFNQCLDDDRCAAEMAAYIEMIIGRHNFSLEQVQKFINTEI